MCISSIEYSNCLRLIKRNEIWSNVGKEVTKRMNFWLTLLTLANGESGTFALKIEMSTDDEFRLDIFRMFFYKVYLKHAQVDLWRF